MEYEIRPEKETTSFTDQPDPRDVITNEDDDKEDLAWLIASAYAFLTEEQNDK